MSDFNVMSTRQAIEQLRLATDSPSMRTVRSALDGQKRSNEDAPLTGLSAGGKLKHSIAS